MRIIETYSKEEGRRVFLPGMIEIEIKPKKRAGFWSSVWSAIKTAFGWKVEQ